MALNPSIILSGQQFDLAGAMQNGLNMAASQKQYDQQNALADLYKTQGANIMAGDQQSLNALAQFDPQAALGIQSEHQQMAIRAEDQQMQRDRARQEAIEYAKTVSAEELAAQTADLTAALSGGSFYHQNGDRAGYDSFLRSRGIDPAQYAFDDFPAHAATLKPVLEAWQSFAPPEGPEWRTATPEEAAANGAVAGQVNTKTGKFDAQNPPSGTQLTTNADGTITFEQGPGVTNGGRTGKPTEGSLASEGYLQRMQKAEDVFTGLSAAGTSALSSILDKWAVGTDAEPYKLSVAEQKLLQAQRDWVRAKLRKESGAVIGPEEMAEEIRTYFPQPGEGKEIAEQKKASRKAAEEQLRITAMLPADQTTTDPADGVPQAGTIEDGFRFKGGDPADPANWEPAQ